MKVLHDFEGRLSGVDVVGRSRSVLVEDHDPVSSDRFVGGDGEEIFGRRCCACRN